MMVEGRGGPVDTDEGSTLLENAAAQGHIFAERTLLGIEGRQAKSIKERLSIGRKIASLTRRGMKEMLKDPDSDKIR